MEYILADKRLKAPEYETAQDKHEKELKKRRRYERRSMISKQRWNNMSALDKAIHAVKISEGQKKAKALRDLYLNNPKQPCAGCARDDSDIYKKLLPTVIWLCPWCATMYDNHGAK